MEERINLFWDNSNIYIVGQNVCAKREPDAKAAFRIHLENLFEFALNNRKLSYAFVGGSIPPQSDNLWRRFEQLGIVVDKQERGAIGGGEIAVDEAIQLRIANRLLDIEVPETIVLLTGDGAGHGDGKGFINYLERALHRGWKIEVVSWDNGCNRYLKNYANENGVYRSLEEVYDKVTFVTNKRWALPIT